MRYTAGALDAAVKLSTRYIHDRKLPDKAIDVIDEVGAAQMLRPTHLRKKTIKARDIEEIVAKMTRVPIKTVTARDRESLRTLDEDIKAAVFGQDEAIEALAAAIKLSRAGLRDPIKPIGCYLFSGPTGVGKTEVAKQLAKVMGVELIRFDMSEYMERHAVSRLIGAPPGYVGFDQGGLLTDAVDQHRHAVLLLDEIEKAHPDVFNILLQVMDYGKLTDNNGKTVDFRNIILIMTTNAGASDMSKPVMGFGQSIDREGEDTEAIKRLFTPEFRNRLDAVIGFRGLSPSIIRNVVDKFVKRARRPARRQAGLDRARRRGGGLAHREGLRPAVWGAAAGPRHPGPDQAAARRRAPVRQARQGRQGLRVDRGRPAGVPHRARGRHGTATGARRRQRRGHRRGSGAGAGRLTLRAQPSPVRTLGRARRRN